MNEGQYSCWGTHKQEMKLRFPSLVHSDKAALHPEWGEGHSTNALAQYLTDEYIQFSRLN